MRKRDPNNPYLPPEAAESHASDRAADFARDTRADCHEFRLPKEAVRKLMLVATAILTPGFLLMLVLSRSKFSLLIAVGLTLGLFGIGYALARSYVYVALSPEGIRGSGGTGRKVIIPWSAKLIVERNSMSGLKGVSVRSTEDGALLGKALYTVFVPDSILESNAFRSVVAAYAPADHPLRKPGAA